MFRKTLISLLLTNSLVFQTAMPAASVVVSPPEPAALTEVSEGIEAGSAVAPPAPQPEAPQEEVEAQPESPAPDATNTVASQELEAAEVSTNEQTGEVSEDESLDPTLDSSENTAAQEGEQNATQDLTQDPSQQTLASASTTEKSDNSSESTQQEEEPKEDQAQPFSANACTGAGVHVSVFAEAGALPAGATMHLRDVSSATAESAASRALNEGVQSAQGVDISFHNAEGTEIEPNSNVQVSIQLPNSLEGEEFSLIHVADSGQAEDLGGATPNGASFASDEFSLYVIAGSGTQQDPIGSVYREYTIGLGETVTILSDEKNHDGSWIPGYRNPGWSAVDIAGGNLNQLVNMQTFQGTADVQPRLVLTAKNKVGTIRVAFRYTHPEDKTHKTLTGEYVATHYYLIHIVDKSTHSYSVQFKNNDGTGVSRVSADALRFTTEEGVTATRTVDNYTHTFTVPEDPTTRAGKVTLIMPEFPYNTERTVNGKKVNFIGWAIDPHANPTTPIKPTSPEPIVYPNPDAHIFAPGDKFPLDRNVTLYAIYAAPNSLTAQFFIRIDDHIPNEPQSHGNASYTRIGADRIYTLPSAQFVTDSVNGIDQGWDPAKQQKPWPAKVFSDLKAAGKLPANVTNVQEFNARYRIVWSTIKRENESWHVDGLLYEKPLYNLAYHENGDLVVVSSMPEGVKDIPAGETTPIDTRIPNRYDMIFTGWNTRADGKGTPYTPGGSVVVSTHPELDTSINTLHLYAQWEKSTKYTYSVHYLECDTNKVLKDPVYYADQIVGNKISTLEESKKASSDIENYVFSYAVPAIGENLIIGEDNSKNVIKLYYMPIEEDISGTALFINKTDGTGSPLAGATFKLMDKNGGVKRYTSDAQGVVQIPFAEDPGANAGDVLTYTIAEESAPDGYAKSRDVFTVSVKRGAPRVVTLFPGNSKTVYPLELTVLRNGTTVDKNSITVKNPKIEPLTIPISATKVLEGRALRAGEFSFELLDAKGDTVASATNAADGSVSFEGVTVAKAGSYSYTLREVQGQDTHITYDRSVYSIAVEVELGQNDKLAVKSTSFKKGEQVVDTLVFTNSFTADPQIWTITYDLNGGVYGKLTGRITERYLDGTEITIHEAPTREGYKFLYWKGSTYYPGDKYTVIDDHIFVAQWEPIEGEKEQEKPKKNEIPTTSDFNGLKLPELIMMISGTSLLAISLRRKRLLNS